MSKVITFMYTPSLALPRAMPRSTRASSTPRRSPAHMDTASTGMCTEVDGGGVGGGCTVSKDTELGPCKDGRERACAATPVHVQVG